MGWPAGTAEGGMKEDIMKTLIWVLSMTVLGTILALLVTLRMAGAEVRWQHSARCQDMPNAQNCLEFQSSDILPIDDQEIRVMCGPGLQHPPGQPQACEHISDHPEHTKVYSCLAKMEAAMRAWDKFVTYGLTMPPATDIPERTRAIALWNSTKAQCWSKPGS